MCCLFLKKFNRAQIEFFSKIWVGELAKLLWTEADHVIVNEVAYLFHSVCGFVYGFSEMEIDDDSDRCRYNPILEGMVESFASNPEAFFMVCNRTKLLAAGLNVSFLLFPLSVVALRSNKFKVVNWMVDQLLSGNLVSASPVIALEAARCLIFLNNSLCAVQSNLVMLKNVPHVQLKHDVEFPVERVLEVVNFLDTASERISLLAFSFLPHFKDFDLFVDNVSKSEEQFRNFLEGIKFSSFEANMKQEVGLALMLASHRFYKNNLERAYLVLGGAIFTCGGHFQDTSADFIPKYLGYLFPRDAERAKEVVQGLFEKPITVGEYLLAVQYGDEAKLEELVDAARRDLKDSLPLCQLCVFVLQRDASHSAAKRVLKGLEESKNVVLRSQVKLLLSRLGKGHSIQVLEQSQTSGSVAAVVAQGLSNSVFCLSQSQLGRQQEQGLFKRISADSSPVVVLLKSVINFQSRKISIFVRVHNDCGLKLGNVKIALSYPHQLKLLQHVTGSGEVFHVVNLEKGQMAEFSNSFLFTFPITSRMEFFVQTTFLQSASGSSSTSFLNGRTIHCGAFTPSLKYARLPLKLSPEKFTALWNEFQFSIQEEVVALANFDVQKLEWFFCVFKGNDRYELCCLTMDHAVVLVSAIHTSSKLNMVVKSNSLDTLQEIVVNGGCESLNQ
jgi:hypothetical protein